VKRAVAACTDRSTISAKAVDAYESRMNDGSGGGATGASLVAARRDPAAAGLALPCVAGR
jgi:hypothetical protein